MPNPSSKPENFSSKIQRIEIQIRDIDPENIKQLLINYFLHDDSPTYPVFIFFDASYRYITEKKGEGISENFRIVEASDDKDQPFEVLAKIRINPFPSHMVVFIEMVSEDDASWDKVTKLTKEIISRMKQLEFNIKSIYPPEILPENFLFIDEDRTASKKPISLTLPKSDEAMKMWKKAYAVMKKRDQEYFNDWEEGKANSSEPKIEDYIDALVQDLGWNRSERTVRKIKAAGKAGLLD